ncbi:Calvin cycle protein cp12-3 protein [Thalictrum thalictroides]|uniref:Calvin cycle protein cp12-3 protein n=1 Tax=Thalictrum thalictroides TaxID=46969 RepID=A0A7J6VYU2_THATH|nr:Calvin cycle protein cp12-3 protein [Thalictrum thalictroides]
MASFVTMNFVSSLKLGSSFRSDDFVKISLPLRNCRNSKSTTVKAMGALKFKGTQMRERKLTEMIEKKILEAKKVCEDDQTSDGCKVAWDEVEEVSQAKADLRRKLEKQDPLESFCSENPETDECRIYED